MSVFKDAPITRLSTGELKTFSATIQNTLETGADGETVNVRDVPALSVLSYTWQGPRGDAEVAKARAAIDAVLAEKKLQVAGYRLFGYNSPSVPRKKQTYELQAVLK